MLHVNPGIEEKIRVLNVRKILTLIPTDYHTLSIYRQNAYCQEEKEKKFKIKC